MSKKIGALLLLLSTTSAGALSKPPPAPAHLASSTNSFLRELHFDPNSPQVTLVRDDLVGTYSLDSLSKKRDENGVKAFIATRAFIRAYMQNQETDFPPEDLYEIRYLKPAEKQFIADALMKPFRK